MRITRNIRKKYFFQTSEILKAINKKNLNLSKSVKTNILIENLQRKNIKKNLQIKYVSINSKNIKRNSIFIGVKGKNFDGNMYANDAIKNGANLAVSNKKTTNPKIHFNQDPLSFLNKISYNFRKSINSNNIAITGSSGKTSVKEL